MARSRLALLPVRSDRKSCCSECWKLKIGENIFENTQVKFEEDLGQKIIQKESYRQIKLKFLGNNNNDGSGQSVGGARSSVGPIEISVCIVSTNEKPSWREHRARDKSLKRCTFENVLTTKQDQSEIKKKKNKRGKKLRSQEVGAEASQTQTVSKGEEIRRFQKSQRVRK